MTNAPGAGTQGVDEPDRLCSVTPALAVRPEAEPSVVLTSSTTTDGLWFQGRQYAAAQPAQNRRRPAVPGDDGPSDGMPQALAVSSSDATLRVRLGSTWTPGPMVVETVTFLM